jgi:tRNA-specific 2-thiouridylase
MSGGVDSSVAAALLVKDGYEVAGGFIKNWSDSKDLMTGECQWRGERRDALRVAAKLGISLHTFDFEKEYRERVLERMFTEYQSGITPNPDVLCNEEIKFGLFAEAAWKLGFDFVATGHYARVVLKPCHSEGVAATEESHSAVGVRSFAATQDDTRAHLVKAVDPDKDQSYFLHRVSQNVLRRTMFPIGQLKKPEVRELAAEFQLPTASKPDSQGICFIGKLDMKEFLRLRIPSSPGEIVTPEGAIVGKHDGLDAYTIGQRQGIQVSKDGVAWYVAGKDVEKNRLIVVPDREHPLLYRSEAVLTNIHWINEPKGGKVEVAVRYHQTPASASFSKQDSKLEFQKPVWALAPGQSAVIFQGEECLGGGFIQ